MDLLYHNQVKTLSPFKYANPDFKLEADAILDRSTLRLVYTIVDSKNLLNLPKGFKSNGTSTPRVDGLWNDTCFELFLRPVGKSSYHEFNFSLKPAWNEYFFESYRLPQPPEQNHDIALQQLIWDGHRLEVELFGFNPSQKYEVSLTAVLKEKSDLIHYMAITHAGAEADFHHVDSFIPLTTTGL